MDNTNQQKPYKPIVIRDVIASKSPGLARIMPRFIINYINRILHIDEVNTVLKKYGHLDGTDFTRVIVKDFEIKQQLVGLENIPETGRFIFASNHPLGGFDSMLLMNTVHNRLGDLRFLVNDVLMNVPQLQSSFVPVNKHGGHSRDVAKKVHEAYDSNVQILIFPSGLASRKVKGEVVDLAWKKHFVTKSIQYKRDVIPVHISGQNSNFFYRLANLRKFFRIKWNLEMFFLVDETYKHRGQKITITFGKPIPYTHFDKSKSHTAWAEEVKRMVYNLPG